MITDTGETIDSDLESINAVLSGQGGGAFERPLDPDEMWRSIRVSYDRQRLVKSARLMELRSILVSEFEASLAVA